MTMATSWSYVAADTYKPTRQLIHLLVDIVAKGGNLLLNICPSPEGELPPVSLERLKEIGAWMRVNSEAVYSTRAIAPYKEGNICFTQNKNGQVNAICLLDENVNTLPAEIRIKGIKPAPKAVIQLKGYEGKLKWKTVNGVTIILVPAKAQKKAPSPYACTFSISAIE